MSTTFNVQFILVIISELLLINEKASATYLYKKYSETCFPDINCNCIKLNEMANESQYKQQQQKKNILNKNE